MIARAGDLDPAELCEVRGQKLSVKETITADAKARDKMHERAVEAAQAQDRAFRQYVQDAAGSGGNGQSTADELSRLADLKDRGVISEEEFQNTLAQKYQYHNVKQACEEKGYAVEEEVNEEDGSIRLVVRKWVSE